MKSTSFSRTAIGAVALVLCLLALPGMVVAQSTGGDLNGKVVDANKAPLPGVTVTATNKDTGLKRSDTTGADGGFRMPSLPAGAYTVNADLTGYGTVAVEDVVINVASSRTLEVTLAQSTVQETVTVVDEAPLVAATPSMGTVVSQAELKNLPLNGRQFANVAVLAPGTSLNVNADPTKPGQLTVALNGGSGRNVNYVIDGGDNTDDTIGGALQNFNLEAVQEFKIQTAQYKAEFGRSTGGVLSVVTKSGTNDLKASGYEYYRDKSLNSESTSEKNSGSGKGDYRRDQYGGSIGGPIVKDKVHFFATYEKNKQSTLDSINTSGLFPQFDGPFPHPFQDELATAKVSADINAAQLLQVRYGYQKNSDIYGLNGTTLPSGLGTILNKYKSMLASHTAQIGSNALNEFTFQYTTFSNTIAAASSDPNLAFPNGVVGGQNPNTPQSTDQTKYQYKDDFSWSTDLGGHRHDWKAGVAYVNEPKLGGSIGGPATQYALLTNDPNGKVTSITQLGGNSFFSTPVKQYGAYLQDDWYASDRLTFNFGIRYDLNKGFDLDQRSSLLWQRLSTQTQYNDPYLRAFQGGKGGVLKNDTNNIAPRLGFSFALDTKSSLRGGVGRFYDFPYTNATILFPAISVQTLFGTTYFLSGNAIDPAVKNADGSYFHVGQPLPAAGQLGLVPSPGDVASPNIKTPYSDQISLGYSREVSPWLGINVEAITVRYKDLPYRMRGNVKLDANGNPQAAQRFPGAGNFRVWQGDGHAQYDGLNLGFRIRQPKFELQGFYTLSKAEGNVTSGADEFRLFNNKDQNFSGPGGSRDASLDATNTDCHKCNGPLYSDARHRVTIGGTYHAPWKLEISGFVRYHSGIPYTKFAPGLVDINGDGFRNDLAPGVDHVNSGRADSFSQFDVRLSREFAVFGDLAIEGIVDGFNVFNAKNGARPNELGVNSRFAGDALQGEQQLIQLGLRLRWK
ncbi:MAG: TonB-dependent receptor [Acidobacteriota bacterium]